MKYIIDRFESGYAVCEDMEGVIKNIPKYQLPLEVKEGDIVSIQNGFYCVLSEETQNRKEELKNKLKNLGHRKKQKKEE